MSFIKKLQSRKLMVIVAVVLLLALGIDVPQELVAALGGTYVIVQGVVDAVGKKTDTES